MPDALEERLLRGAAQLPEPPADATARARSAALAALPSARRRRARRGVRIAVAGVVTAAVAAVLALLLVATPSRDADAPPSIRPDPDALGTLRACSRPRDLWIVCVDGTEAVRRTIPALDGAPWLYREAGEDRARPSLEFPPGVTYAEALDALVESVTLTGRLPAHTTLRPPLPAGAVLLMPAAPSEGIAIDLRTPFGYTPFSGARPPLLYGDATPAVAEGRVWAPGARVAVPELPDCMVVPDRHTAPPPCGIRDDARFGAGAPRAPDLPAVPLLPPADPVGLSLPVLRAGPGAPVPGRRMDLLDLRGRVVVLTSFTSRCQPCIGTVEAAVEAARAYRIREDVVVLGVDLDDDRADGLRFAEQAGLPFAVLRAESGDPRVRVLGLSAPPATVVVGRDGRILASLPGGLPDAGPLRREIDRALAAP